MRFFHTAPQSSPFRSRLEPRAGLIAVLIAVLAAAFSLIAPAQGLAKPVTKCTTLSICYCVNTDYLDAIDAKVARVRKQLADNKAQGKAIGYLSIPLSPAGGGSSEINSRVATRTANALTKHLGVRSVWILNPGASDSGDPAAADPMQGASGADYMYMWTQILAGSAGLGEDFDFFYFTGPSDFAGYFELTADGTLDQLEKWFDEKIPQDPVLKKSIEDQHVTRTGFRNYYGLRASVAFSYGSHDEWNIARLIDERRRGATDFGIANQLAIFFDGRPVTPGGYENPAASGDAGRCIN